eukprot:3030829-Lingulodinium_polyedra.AAC.1
MSLMLSSCPGLALAFFFADALQPRALPFLSSVCWARAATMLTGGESCVANSSRKPGFSGGGE